MPVGKFIRPPGMIVRKALCFTAVIIYFFYSPQDLRVLLADRHEILPHDGMCLIL